MSARDGRGNTEPGGDRMVIRTRDGSCFGVPIETLSEYILPEDAVVIAWAPSRYLAVPRERLEQFRMTDGDMLRFTASGRKGPVLRDGPSGLKASGPPHRRRGRRG